MSDFFLSHSREVKVNVAIPLAQMLGNLGFSCWIDRKNIVVGDSIFTSIEKAIQQSFYAVAIVDKNYLSRDWPLKELNLFIAKEEKENRNLIIPVYVNIEKEEVYRQEPRLEGRAFEKVSEKELSFVQKIDITSRILSKYYNENTKIRNFEEIMPLLNNHEFSCKESLITLIQTKFFSLSDLRLSIIELSNIQGMAYAIYNHLASDQNKIIKTSYNFFSLLRDYFYDEKYHFTYNVYSACFSATLASLGELRHILYVS